MSTGNTGRGSRAAAPLADGHEVSAVVREQLPAEAQAIGLLLVMAGLVILAFAALVVTVVWFTNVDRPATFLEILGGPVALVLVIRQMVRVLRRAGGTR